MKILVPIGCRSDAGLSAPVIRRLKNHFDVETVDLIPYEFMASYKITDCCIKHHVPDLILITGDRVEMCAAAASAFHNKVKIAHLYAGCIGTRGTFDEQNRHCITIWSDLQLCENQQAKWFCEDLKRSVMLEPNAHIVGITHLDDMEINEGCVPKEILPKSIYPGKFNLGYDLLLLNNEPLSVDQPIPDLTEFTIQLGGNPDGNFKTYGDVIYPAGVSRPEFFGLLKNCQRFITNSSSAIYEAPYFLKPHQVIRIGTRNKNRGDIICKPGGSDRVVSEIVKYSE